VYTATHKAEIKFSEIKTWDVLVEESEAGGLTVNSSARNGSSIIKSQKQLLGMSITFYGYGTCSRVL